MIRSKLLSVKSGVIFPIILWAIFFFGEGWTADWRFFRTTNEGEFLYDADSLTHPSINTVGILMKVVYSEKVKEREGLDNLGQTVGLWEINCNEKMIRLLSTSHYSKEGEMLDPHSPRILLTPDWESISPGTVLEALWTQICK